MSRRRTICASSRANQDRSLVTCSCIVGVVTYAGDRSRLLGCWSILCHHGRQHEHEVNGRGAIVLLKWLDVESPRKARVECAQSVTDGFCAVNDAWERSYFVAKVGVVTVSVSVRKLDGISLLLVLWAR
jgi:hypothetical protein